MINSSKKILIGTVITVAVGLLVWNFSAVASMPETYATKSDNTEEHRNIERKLDEIKNLIMKLHMKK